MILVLSNSPQERLASYTHWPVHLLYWPYPLALAGFSYTGRDNIVRCFTCNYTASVNSWSPPQNPSEAHAHYSPGCSFVYGLQMCPTFDTTCPTDYNSVVMKNKHSFRDNHSTKNDSILAETDTSPTYKLTDGSVKRLKYPQFESVMSRIQTYTNWNYSSKQRPILLSEAGFFYTGEADIVRCFCCDLGLTKWNPQNDPWVEHARHNCRCLFLRTEKGEDYVNKIYNQKHPAFEDKDSRLKTFAGVWRTDIEQTPQILVDAGFFYTGEEDVVRCHYCDGGLRHWEPGDIPWEEHARWFPFCKFLIKMKGREYIEEIKRKTEERQRSESTVITASHLPCLPASSHSMKEDEEEEDNYITGFVSKQAVKKYPQKIKETNRQLKEKMKCIRCRTNDICMLFVNCGHRQTCEECADLVDFCPFCDTRIKERLKIFLF